VIVVGERHPSASSTSRIAVISSSACRSWRRACLALGHHLGVLLRLGPEHTLQDLVAPLGVAFWLIAFL
jgi:hypothetical protein